MPWAAAGAATLPVTTKRPPRPAPTAAAHSTYATPSGWRRPKMALAATRPTSRCRTPRKNTSSEIAEDQHAPCPRRGDERQGRGEREAAGGADDQCAERRPGRRQEIQAAEPAPRARDAEQQRARRELDAHQVLCRCHPQA